MRGSLLHTWMRARNARIFRHWRAASILLLWLSLLPLLAACDQNMPPSSSHPSTGTGPQKTAALSVYVGVTDNSFEALDAATGIRRWKVATPAMVKSQPSAVFGGLVVTTDFAGTITAWNTRTGAQVWRVRTGGAILGSPVFGGPSLIYAGATDGHLYAIKSATGTGGGWQTITAGAIETTPVLDPVDHRVFVASDEGGGGIIGFDEATGARLGIFSPGTNSVFAASPVFTASTGLLYMGFLDGTVSGLHASGFGGPVWQRKLDGPVTTLSVDGGLLYVGTENGHLVALNASSGANVWQFATGSAVHSPPRLDRGQLYVGTDDTGFFALNAASGKQLWHVGQTGDRCDTSADVALSLVIFGCNHQLEAVNTMTGAVVWSVSGAGSIASPRVGP